MLLFVEMSAAAAIAAAIILPFGLFFAPSSRWPSCRLPLTRTGGTPGHSHPGGPGVPRPPLILAALAGVALLVTATIALPRETGGTDPAAQGN
jgi:hypothetical protein